MGRLWLGPAEPGGAIWWYAVLALMVLPIPAWLLDLLHAEHRRGAGVDDGRGLHAAAAGPPFPSVLLLHHADAPVSLNVASTRVVLLEGHTGPGAASAVIKALGISDRQRFAVGLIVFTIW